MKSKWYANWLIVITVCLFISSLGLFVISLKNNIGFTKCAYGEDVGENCICTTEGEKVCDEESEQEEQALKSSAFITDGLKYTFDFVDYIDAGNRRLSEVVFSDISYLGGGLNIVLEIEGFCDDRYGVARQMGLYKLEDSRLTLTVGNNISDESYSIPCITKSQFFISNFPKEVGENFQVIFQDEFNSLYVANNCVYEGYIRNSEDVYNSEDGCYLCQCIDGGNVCQKESTCLE